MPHATTSEMDSTMSQPPPSSPPLTSSMELATADTMPTDSPNGTKDEEEQVDLLELFDKDNIDDDEDDEFAYPPSSGIAKNMANLAIPSSSPPQLPKQIDTRSRFTDPDIMLAYYRRLLPFRTLYQWLNHGVKPSADMANRELAFTLEGDKYVRYQSYTTADLFRKDVLRLNPSRFEIGPVYTSNPRDRKSLKNAAKFQPVSKELCFDLDLTDYDPIRTCCKEANICLKCWQWATMAVKVVDTCLREDFGFEHIMWVYSGRRGIHAWICDKRARELGDDKRRAIANYLMIVFGDKKANLRRPLHPHLERSIQILAGHFQKDILRDQDPWRTATQAEKLLNFITDKPLATALKKKWDSAPGRSSTSKWSDIDAVASSGISSSIDGKALNEAKRDIVLEYTYPRLDIAVSKHLNHLLKSPFVIHPGTGRVCVPLPLPPREDGNEDWSVLESFNPLEVPTVIDILNEIDAWDSKELEKQSESQQDQDATMDDVDSTPASSKPKIQDYEKTSIKPHVDYFKAFVANLIKSESRSLKRERGDEDGADIKTESMEF